MNNSKIPTSNTVNGVSGPVEIADMWHAYGELIMQTFSTLWTL